MTNKPLTLGSLFDGSGGFPLGGLLAGITPVWASEIEPFPIRVTTKRLPFMKHYGNISAMDTKVSFPWFPATPAPDELNAYDTFICKLCEIARNQARVNTSEKPTDNEKYAFRCFLLRLGFIGAEYKTARKTLLKNLSGSSAFRNGGAQHEISE